MEDVTQGKRTADLGRGFEPQDFLLVIPRLTPCFCRSPITAPVFPTSCCTPKPRPALPIPPSLQVPDHCPGVPDEVLHPEVCWGDREAFDAKLADLGGMFTKVGVLPCDKSWSGRRLKCGSVFPL